jgi:hypothetical protein
MMNNDKVTRVLRCLHVAQAFTEKAHFIAINAEDDETRKRLSHLLRQYHSEIVRIAETYDAPFPGPKS